MSAQTDVDFVLFIYYISLRFYVSCSIGQDPSHLSESTVFPLILDDNTIMVITQEGEGKFVFGRVLSLVGLVILFGLEAHFADEGIETYVRKPDFAQKRAKKINFFIEIFGKSIKNV